MRSSLAVSSSVSDVTGMPVHEDRTSAISSSLTSARASPSASRHSVFLLGALGHEALLFVAEAGGRLEVLSLDRLFLLAARVGDLLFELPVVGRCAHATDAQPRAGLVDQVDRLVRQEPVADVTVREVRRGDETLVGDRARGGEPRSGRADP